MATKKKVKEMLFKAGIARLIDWLWDKRWDVEFDHMTHGEMDPMTKCVTIKLRELPIIKTSIISKVIFSIKIIMNLIY